MAQIIPQSSFSTGLASALGQGLGEGLQQLAQHKLMQLHQQREQSRVGHGLQSLGFSPEQSQQLAGLPPALLGPVIKNYLAAAENSGLEEALGALSGQPVQNAQSIDQNPIQNYQLGQQVEPEGISTPLAQEAAAKVRQPSVAAPQKGNSLKDILQRPRLNAQQKIKLAEMQQRRELSEKKLEAAERKETYAQQAKVDKETKPFYDEISKAAKAAKDSNKRLDRMEELVNRGKLGPALYNSMLKLANIGGHGIDLSALQTADAQEFNKLSRDFLKDAKAIFGSRLTDTDVKTFLETVPNLSQSDAGRRRVIHNLRSFNEAALIRQKAMQKIIKEHNGKRPANIDALVDEAVEPQLDALAKEFRQGAPAHPKDKGVLGKLGLSLPFLS